MKSLLLFYISIIGCVVCSTVTATPTADGGKVVVGAFGCDTDAGVAPEWERNDALDPDFQISFSIALKQRNTDRLIATLLEVSDPGHANYRKYLGVKDVAVLLAPLPEDVAAVVAFLGAHGLTGSSVLTGDWLEVHGVPVRTAERMFNRRFARFTHARRGTQFFRVGRPCEGYELPARVAAAVDFVGGVTRLPKTPLETRQLASATGPTPSQQFIRDEMPAVTPDFLKQLYGIPPNIVSTNPGNSQAVAEFLKQYYSNDDLQKYLHTFGVPQQDVARVVGFNNETMPGGEASLDIQVIMGVSAKARTEFWSFSGLRNNSAPAGPDNQEPFLRYMRAISNSTDAEVPLVHSFSYDDNEDSLTAEYMERCNVEFAKAGVRGLSLFFAAGDDGIGGMDVRQGKPCTRSVPAFPSSSPWVTSVGGSQMSPLNVKVEVVADSRTGSVITTGGGFSDVFPTPKYQAEAVASYLRRAKLPPASWFNAAGRAYPDISGIATNYLIYVGGKIQHIGGTSASTPLIAAMVSLLNDSLLNKGVGPMGWINPFLYRTSALHPTAFTDIVKGDNACSANATRCCAYGFEAAAGWDAASGVGSPVWDELADLVLM